VSAVEKGAVELEMVSFSAFVVNARLQVAVRNIAILSSSPMDAKPRAVMTRPNVQNAKAVQRVEAPRLASR